MDYYIYTKYGQLDGGFVFLSSALRYGRWLDFMGVSYTLVDGRSGSRGLGSARSGIVTRVTCPGASSR